jgi:hypothetical protein
VQPRHDRLLELGRARHVQLATRREHHAVGAVVGFDREGFHGVHDAAGV